MKSVLLVKKFLQLVEVTSGLVNASFRFPEWQAVNKNDCLCTLAQSLTVQPFMRILIFGKPTMNMLMCTLHAVVLKRLKQLMYI